MKIYIILARVYCKAENCWFDVYHNAYLDKDNAYHEALRMSNKSNYEEIQYTVEEVTLT